MMGVVEAESNLPAVRLLAIAAFVFVFGYHQTEGAVSPAKLPYKPIVDVLCGVCVDVGVGGVGVWVW